MSTNELIAVENQEVALTRPPEIVLEEAQRAARALQDVISKKKNPVVFTNGEQYLEFEDWQTLGRFYGITAKAVSTKYVEYGEASGFESYAEAIHVATGKVISGATGMCMNDEGIWSSKPKNQLCSMSQTRACAKALRNVLAWTAVLAGYRPTPAEEMPQETATEDSANGGLITEKQIKFLKFKVLEAAKRTNRNQEQVTAFVKQMMKDHGIEETKNIPKMEVDHYVKALENYS